MTPRIITRTIHHAVATSRRAQLAQTPPHQEKPLCWLPWASTGFVFLNIMYLVTRDDFRPGFFQPMPVSCPYSCSLSLLCSIPVVPIPPPLTVYPVYCQWVFVFSQVMSFTYFAILVNICMHFCHIYEQRNCWVTGHSHIPLSFLTWQISITQRIHISSSHMQGLCTSPLSTFSVLLSKSR